jgi:hypothetical protein
MELEKEVKPSKGEGKKKKKKKWVSALINIILFCKYSYIKKR